ncbi:MAG: hypothetical protein WC375_12150 [Methanomassiliicoccales archaeon]|jgi:DNA-directed RNA polymerase specialized sigma24 family protein
MLGFKIKHAKYKAYGGIMASDKRVAKKLKASLDIPKEVDENFNIDRRNEDDMVADFQKSGDLRILEKVYHLRVPTLRVWANKHFYPDLIASVDDLFEEFTVTFVKAAHKYNRKRGSFNTCLFTFLLNRVKNIKSSKHAKKRISENYDGPLNGMVLSLDYSYNDKDGDAITLKDVVANCPPEEACEGVICKLCAEETLDLLAHENMDFRGFLQRLSDGTSFASLIKEYKTRQGRIKLTSSQFKQMSGRAKKIEVANLVRSKGHFKDDFKLIEYNVASPHWLSYTIEMRKTNQTDNIIKKVRELRKNKGWYLHHIRGSVPA